MFDLAVPCAWGGPVAAGVMKAAPEEFVVEECLALDPAGQGEHLYCFVEKRGENTDYVARMLAQHVRISDQEVGYCGLKDRHAVTRQWFSLRLPGAAGPELADEDLSDSVHVLKTCRGPRKLRRGEHESNRFEILIRHDAEGALLEPTLQRIQTQGFPNYFGPQRFGREGENIQRAETLALGRQRRRDPHEGLYLSAARSWLFNQALAQRVREGTWQLLPDGDAGVPWAGLQVASGPLFGDGPTGSSGILQAEEERLRAAYPAFHRVFRDRRLTPERRALCVVPDALRWQHEAAGLRLFFSLPPGAFATSLLAELFSLSEPDRTWSSR